MSATIQRSPGLDKRLPVLDGWRGISILLVLACHLLPLGPGRWNLNGLAGPLGMSIFFTLSGFLITSTLLEKPDVRSFFIRRACRIVPLAYLFTAVALLVQHQSFRAYLGYLFFYANYKGELLTPMTSPLWSLCVEVHFYAFIGLLVLLGGRRSLLLLPLLALTVTALRIRQHAYTNIETHLRVDEILAGATVALIHHENWGARVRSTMSRIPTLVFVALALASSHPRAAALQYARPYLGAAMVASTLWRPGYAALLESRWLKYCAEISYALYVIHPINRFGWLATGTTFERYLIKRPVGILAAFALAHLSTFYYEKQWIRLGRHLSGPPRNTAAVPALVVAESGAH